MGRKKGITCKRYCISLDGDTYLRLCQISKVNLGKVSLTGAIRLLVEKHNNDLFSNIGKDLKQLKKDYDYGNF